MTDETVRTLRCGCWREELNRERFDRLITLTREEQIPRDFSR